MQNVGTLAFHFPMGTARETVIASILAFYGESEGGALGTLHTPVQTVATGGTPAHPISTTDAGTGVTVERDKNGTPWDERIHSNAKSKNADGTWRKRKGLDDATYAAVMAELGGAPMSAEQRKAGEQWGVAVPEGCPMSPEQYVEYKNGNHPTNVSPAVADWIKQDAARSMQQADAQTAPALSLPSLQPAGLPQLSPTVPVIPQPTPYSKFVDFVATHTHDPVTNPTGRINNDYVQQVLAAFSKNAVTTIKDAGAPEHAGVVQAAHAHIAQQLGVAVE